jgi:hypothetical protein
MGGFGRFALGVDIPGEVWDVLTLAAFPLLFGCSSAFATACLCFIEAQAAARLVTRELPLLLNRCFFGHFLQQRGDGEFDFRGAEGPPLPSIPQPFDQVSPGSLTESD